MTIQERAKHAVDLKTSGRYNCAQAVTAVLADVTPLTIEQLNQITAGFCAGIPIVAVTANTFEEDRQSALQSGMNGHLAKPYDIPAIIETLKGLLK